MNSVFDPADLRLMGITDDLRDGVDGLAARAAAAVRGGVTMLQVRLKDADSRTAVEVTRAILVSVAAAANGRRVPVLVNDRVDIALAAGADGVHLGADDLPVSAARSITPAGFIIGASVGAPAEVANAAQADYVGIGPVYATATKSDAGTAIGLDGLVALSRLVTQPVVAIGGITAVTAGEVCGAGAQGVAVVRAIFGASDVERAARAIRSAIDRGA